MTPRPGATIACASGLGVAALLAAGIVFRKDLAAAWHLHRLRTDEGYLARIIEAPDGSIEDRALRWHASTARGKNALFLLHADEMAVEAASWSCCRDVFASRGIIWFDADHLRSEAICDGRRTWSARSIHNAARLHAIARYLPFLQGTDFAWPDDAGLKLHVIPTASAADLLDRPDVAFPGAAPWVWCFERVLEPSAEERFVREALKNEDG